MKKQRSKIIDLKQVAFLLLTLVLTSCSFKDIFAYPVDRPATTHNTHIFNQSYDSLQLKTDKFIFNSLNIDRFYSEVEAYDKGEYRKYKMICTTDTLYFSLVFAHKDTFSRINLDFFKIQNVAFNTIEVKEKREAIKDNKEIYDKGLKCYQEIFLNPLIKYIEGDTVRK